MKKQALLRVKRAIELAKQKVKEAMKRFYSDEEMEKLLKNNQAKKINPSQIQIGGSSYEQASSFSFRSVGMTSQGDEDIDGWIYKGPVQASKKVNKAAQANQATQQMAESVRENMHLSKSPKPPVAKEQESVSPDNGWISADQMKANLTNGWKPGKQGYVIAPDGKTYERNSLNGKWSRYQSVNE